MARNIYIITDDVEDMGYTVEEAAKLIREAIEDDGWDVEIITKSGAVSVEDIPDHIADKIENALCG